VSGRTTAVKRRATYPTPNAISQEAAIDQRRRHAAQVANQNALAALKAAQKARYAAANYQFLHFQPTDLNAPGPHPTQAQQRTLHTLQEVASTKESAASVLIGDARRKAAAAGLPNPFPWMPN